jgi:hypothetical protein
MSTSSGAGSMHASSGRQTTFRGVIESTEEERVGEV